MKIKKIISLLAAAVMAISVPMTVLADIITYPYIILSGIYYGNMEVKDEYAYIPSSKTGEGVQIIDISEPEEMYIAAIARCDIPNNSGIAIEGNYLYAQTKDKQIVVFNIKEPEKPKMISSVSYMEQGRLCAYEDTLVLTGMQYIQFYDISDPTKISLVSTLANPNRSYYYGAVMDDEYVYYVDNLYNFTVVNYTDVKAPKIETQLKLSQTPEFIIVYNLVLEDNLVYFGTIYDNKVWCVDVSEPAAPKVRAQWTAGGAGEGVYKDGNDLYFMAGGITQCFDVTNPENPTLKFSTGYGGSNAYVIDGRYIIWNDIFKFRLTDMQGSYDIAGLPAVPNESVVLGETDSEEKNYFKDTIGHWGKDDIYTLYDLGVVKGVGDNSFEPDREINRAEFYTILSSVLAIEIERYKQEFTDVSDNDWYSDIMHTCYKNGIISKEMIKNGKALSTQSITREEMAASVYNASELFGIKTNGSEGAEFADGGQISDWAKEGVLSCANDGIFIGDENGYFNPQSSATRAECCAAVMRFRKCIVGEYEEPVFLDNMKYDIRENTAAEFKEWAYTGKKDEYLGVPHILRVSDAISPDEMFNLYGENFDDTTRVYITPVDLEQNPPEEPDTASALDCKVVGTDSDEKVATVIMPAEASAGSYYLWAGNSEGWSSPVYLNGARPKWIDRDEAASGQIMRVVGRNLDGREFDASLSTNVAFVKEDKVYYGEIVSVNPFAIEVIPPEGIEQGEYKVAVTSDGVSWFEVSETPTIKLIGDIDDPLELGVAWADKFTYDNKVDITKAPYNAVRDGTNNVTNIIQKAVDDVKAQGGGIVYIPAGEYLVSSVDLPADVIIMGDGMEKTILTYSTQVTAEDDAAAPHLGNYMFHSKDDGVSEGRHGLYGFQIQLAPNEAVPDHYIWFGSNTWGDEIYDQSLRSTQYIFVKRIKINSPLTRKTTDGRGYGAVAVMKSHFLFNECVFYGYQASCGPIQNANYSYVTDNHFTTAVLNVSVVGSYAVFENNIMNRNLRYAAELMNTQGIFFRGYVYCTENVVRGTGMPGANDGELFCCETYMGGSKFGGKVASADKTSLCWSNDEFEAYNGNNYKENMYGISQYAYNDGWYVVIVGGRGLGQTKRISEIDEQEQKIILDGEWDITPDGTSRFNVCLPNPDVTIYNNYANSGSKGCWLYGDNSDGVVVKNNLINTEGVFIYTSEHTLGLSSSLFARLEGNKTLGYSPESNVCGIGVQAEAQKSYTPQIIAYGVEIKDNDMTGGEKGVYIEGQEAPPIDGIYVMTALRQKDITGQNHIIKGSIVEGNTVRDMATGISIGPNPDWLQNTGLHSRGYAGETYVRKNTFENVEEEYNDLYNLRIDIK